MDSCTAKAKVMFSAYRAGGSGRSPSSPLPMASVVNGISTMPNITTQLSVIRVASSAANSDTGGGSRARTTTHHHEADGEADELGAVRLPQRAERLVQAVGPKSSTVVISSVTEKAKIASKNVSARANSSSSCWKRSVGHAKTTTAAARPSIAAKRPSVRPAACPRSAATSARATRPADAPCDPDARAGRRRSPAIWLDAQRLAADLGGGDPAEGGGGERAPRSPRSSRCRRCRSGRDPCR